MGFFNDFSRRLNADLSGVKSADSNRFFRPAKPWLLPRIAGQNEQRKSPV
jgi:hypothetical protein